jgi:hypothetical protein
VPPDGKTSILPAESKGCGLSVSGSSRIVGLAYTDHLATVHATDVGALRTLGRLQFDSVDTKRKPEYKLRRLQMEDAVVESNGDVWCKVCGWRSPNACHTIETRKEFVRRHYARHHAPIEVLHEKLYDGARTVGDTNDVAAVHRARWLPGVLQRRGLDESGRAVGHAVARGLEGDGGRNLPGRRVRLSRSSGHGLPPAAGRHRHVRQVLRARRQRSGMRRARQHGRRMRRRALRGARWPAQSGIAVDTEREAVPGAQGEQARPPVPRLDFLQNCKKTRVFKWEKCGRARLPCTYAPSTGDA